MSDETRPEAYADHDAAYRQEVAEAKLALNDALEEYPPEVQVAAAMESVNDQLVNWTYEMYGNRWEDDDAE